MNVNVHKNHLGGEGGVGRVRIQIPGDVEIYQYYIYVFIYTFIHVQNIVNLIL